MAGAEVKESMRFVRYWSRAIGLALLSCLLLTGVALAAPQNQAEQAPAQPSPGMQELMGQIRSLRKARLEQFRAEVEGLIKKAEADGKITPEEAARLRQPRSPRVHQGHDWLQGASEKEVKAKLKEAVKSGRLTQKQADQLLAKWKEWKSKNEQAPKR